MMTPVRYKYLQSILYYILHKKVYLLYFLLYKNPLNNLNKLCIINLNTNKQTTKQIVQFSNKCFQYITW